MNQNFNAVKKLLTIVALVCACFACSAQAIVYRNGQPVAKGIVQSTNNKVLYLRVYENNKLSTKMFFKASIEKLVLEDSVSVALYEANPYDYPAVVSIDIKRNDYSLFDKKISTPDHASVGNDVPASNADLSPRITTNSDLIINRMLLAEKHVSNASTSMLLSFGLGIAGALVVTNMASSATTAGELRDAGVASIAFGGVSFGLFINALIQNTKASTLLKTQ